MRKSLKGDGISVSDQLRDCFSQSRCRGPSSRCSCPAHLSRDSFPTTCFNNLRVALYTCRLCFLSAYQETTVSSMIQTTSPIPIGILAKLLTGLFRRRVAIRSGESHRPFSRARRKESLPPSSLPAESSASFLNHRRTRPPRTNMGDGPASVSHKLSSLGSPGTRLFFYVRLLFPVPRPSLDCNSDCHHGLCPILNAPHRYTFLI